MPQKMGTGVVLVLLAHVFLGCGGTPPASPAAPSQVTPQPAPLPSPVPAPPPQPPSTFVYAPGYVLTGVSLSGVINEVTPAGLTPADGVSVYCDACGITGHTFLNTDKDGRYRFSGDLSQGGG